MEPVPRKTNSSRALWIATAALLAVVVGVAAWPLLWRDNEDKETRAGVTGEQMEQFFVGISALDVGSDQLAMEAFAELAKSLPDEPAVWGNLAIAQLRLNELDAADAAVTKAIELDPDDDRFIYSRSLIRGRSGQLEQAVYDLKRLSEPDVAALYLQAEYLHRLGDEASHRNRLAVLKQILQLRPDNLLVHFERARLAAQLEDREDLQQSLEELSETVGDWSEQAAQLFASAQEAAADSNFREAATQLTFLQNVSKANPSYQASANELDASGNSPGRPVREFKAHEMPAVVVAESDLGLAFEMQPASAPADRARIFLALQLFDQPGATTVSISGDQLRVGATDVLRLPETDGAPVSVHSIASVDLNADFRPDLVLVGGGGIVLYIQDENGRFIAHTPTADEQEAFQQPARAVWPLDVEADGDLDLLISHDAGGSALLRNNGDMTFAAEGTFRDLSSPRQILWTDFDNDGDIDIVALDAQGALFALSNERSGIFSDPLPLLAATRVVAIATGDIDHDGIFEIVALDERGRLHSLSRPQADQRWIAEELTRWESPVDLQQAFQAQRVTLFLEDIDNNGGIDVIASAEQSTAAWLNDLEAPFQALNSLPELFVTSVRDIDGDGRLDLVGTSDGDGRVARNISQKGYHWQTISARANPAPGDSRINSLGIGGTIDLRAGRLLQTAPITSMRNHFGLGEYEQAGVARIVWPNGSVQAEFSLKADQTLVVQQRLKGSCPFVFARNGDEITFIKDFIWRSPLGLKINSQETAGITQTEDWIKIPGDKLSSTDGWYELRITADLWETHFFDHISLLVVDHPAAVEVYVDERFVPNQQPELAAQAMAPSKPFDRIWDHNGDDVADRVNSVDGRYLDSFRLGQYQGIAEDHWVEFELAEDFTGSRPMFIVGEGWIYPTDSSLNVAISQGTSPAPQGLTLEVLGADGHWRPVGENLGFPAGKNKTVLLPVPDEIIQSGHRRFRLRTNLEVYWDYLGWTHSDPNADLVERRIDLEHADLRYRGFSQMSPPDRRKPDTPLYDRLEGTGQRWRDLEGFYTRFGDVRELLQAVDDRYVIMNAGDEMVLKFPAFAPPPAGWKRDFVLIGDGWVKDGDYNTAFSRTVHPLPSHGSAEPPGPAASTGPAGSLFDDPVYLRHAEDWRHYHTRYVTPSEFSRGLRPPSDTTRTR